MKVRMSEGSETFEMLRKPSIKLILKVYLFNVTNRDEYMSGKDDKLKFQQVGPYAYSEDMSHGNVTFNANGIMTAIPLHPLRWLPELSNGTEEDMIVLPNIALLSIAKVMSDATFFTRVGLNLLIRQTNTQPLVRMTAKDFMFVYKSTLLSLGNKFVPSWISFDKLGLVDRTLRVTQAQYILERMILAAVDCLRTTTDCRICHSGTALLATLSTGLVTAPISLHSSNPTTLYCSSGNLFAAQCLW